MERAVIRERGFSLMELLMVIALMGVIAAIAIPMGGNALHFIKLSGDARDLSNATSAAKMRAAAKFTTSRLYVDIVGKTSYIQTYDKTAAAWVNEVGGSLLSSSVTFGYGVVGTPPPNSQGAIGQASACMNTATPPVAIANTACVIFNSRGIPIDTLTPPNPTSEDAVYVTDGVSVYGVTVSATGFIRVSQTPNQSTPTWTRQ